MVLLIVVIIASLAVSWRFRSKIQTYSKVALSRGLTGAEIAEQMLRDHQITDVSVITSEGQLTDHYNPVKKTVNLSHDVYYGRSIASAAIAAHECGHAVQHAQAYSMLKFRTAMVPVQNASARVMNIILLMMFVGGYFLTRAFPLDIVFITVIVCQAVITLFSLVTLPVEFDASKRAMAWMTSRGIVYQQETDQAKDALKWAAMTYVVAALAAVAQLLYWIAQFTGRRD